MYSTHSLAKTAAGVLPGVPNTAEVLAPNEKALEEAGAAGVLSAAAPPNTLEVAVGVAVGPGVVTAALKLKAATGVAANGVAATDVF